MSMPEMTTGGLRPPTAPTTPSTSDAATPPAGRNGGSVRPSERLVALTRQHLRRSRSESTRGPLAPIDLEPATAHEAVTREMVLALQREVAQLRLRLDALFYLMVGSVLLEVLLRLIGAG